MAELCIEYRPFQIDSMVDQVNGPLSFIFVFYFILFFFYLTLNMAALFTASPGGCTQQRRRLLRSQ